MQLNHLLGSRGGIGRNTAAYEKGLCGVGWFTRNFKSSNCFSTAGKGCGRMLFGLLAKKLIRILGSTSWQSLLASVFPDNAYTMSRLHLALDDRALEGDGASEDGSEVRKKKKKRKKESAVGEHHKMKKNKKGSHNKAKRKRREERNEECRRVSGVCRSHTQLSRMRVSDKSKAKKSRNGKKKHKTRRYERRMTDMDCTHQRKDRKSKASKKRHYAKKKESTEKKQRKLAAQSARRAAAKMAEEEAQKQFNVILLGMRQGSQKTTDEQITHAILTFKQTSSMAFLSLPSSIHGCFVQLSVMCCRNCQNSNLCRCHFQQSFILSTKIV